MIRPVTILILVSKGNILILTGPSLKEEGSSLTSADLRNLKSASDTGFETAEPRRTHRSTCFFYISMFLRSQMSKHSTELLLKGFTFKTGQFERPALLQMASFRLLENQML